MSSKSAPCSTSRSPWATAASVSRNCPPSEKLSGVMLTMPKISGGAPGVRVRSRSCQSGGADMISPCNFHHVDDLLGHVQAILLLGRRQRFADFGPIVGDGAHQY